MHKDLSATREVCEGCGIVAEGAEFRSGDESTYNAAGVSWGPRWSSPPLGWLTAYDACGEHWVCSVTCARKVDSVERARQVLESGEVRAKSGAR
jgi:hypothetical protein